MTANCLIRLYSGLLERVNEMRYANQAHPLQREAIRHQILPANVNNNNNDDENDDGNNVGNNVGNNDGNNGGNNGGDGDGDPNDAVNDNAINDNANGQEHRDGQNQFPQPLDDRLLYDDDEREELRQQEDQRIPLPNARGGRRPYHVLARENAEALNALLTRDIPVLTDQLRETMDLMNQLVRRQLNN